MAEVIETPNVTDKPLIKSTTIIGGLILILAALLGGVQHFASGGTAELFMNANELLAQAAMGIAIIGGRKALGKLIVTRQEEVEAIKSSHMGGRR